MKVNLLEAPTSIYYKSFFDRMIQHLDIMYLCLDAIISIIKGPQEHSMGKVRYTQIFFSFIFFNN